MALDPRNLDPTTWLISGGRPVDAGAPLNHPIVPASTFEHGGDRIYSRSDATEGWEALEAVVGGLEQAEALVFGSGMAAVSAVFDLVPVGGHVVIPDDCYHGVAETAEQGVATGRFTMTKLPMDATWEWVAAQETADLVWAESPTNPLLTVADLEAICDAPRRHECLLVVDNTFATALRQQPLALGADVCMQSTTKFIGGHSDLLGGVLTTRNPDLLAALRTRRARLGASPGALEVFLMLRGIRTMAMRLDRAEENAGALAEHLRSHAAVSHVRYPGFGAVISFDLADGAMADRCCAALQIIRHATSLGGVESMIERRGRYAGQAHLPAGLLRMSVGCEAAADLWADLRQALDG
ncbi:MAG: trans-sulfuration enzyme family protein [Acidimicrobiales bacterium]